MDVLFKKIAYGLNVDIRRTYELNVTPINVSRDELQSGPGIIHNWEELEHEKLNRIVFDTKDIGEIDDPSPLIHELAKLTRYSPDIQISEYNDEGMRILNDCLLFE